MWVREAGEQSLSEWLPKVCLTFHIHAAVRGILFQVVSGIFQFPKLAQLRAEIKALHLESQERTAFVLDGLSATAVQVHQAEGTGASHQGTRSQQRGSKPLR